MEAAERKREKKIYTAKKNMQQSTRSICCVVSFVAYAKKPVPKDAIYLSETFAPADYQRKQFIYNKQELLIPHPLTKNRKHIKKHWVTGQKINVS
jgi:NADH-quinone oxidoreductase subunit I